MQKEQLEGNRIFRLHGLLTPDECAALIERSEGMSYEPGTVGRVRHRTQQHPRALQRRPAG